jgi:hypothetical protein
VQTFVIQLLFLGSRRHIQEFLNGRRDVLRFSRWGETIMDLSGLLDKKFGEVPFDGF